MTRALPASVPGLRDWCASEDDVEHSAECEQREYSDKAVESDDVWSLSSSHAAESSYGQSNTDLDGYYTKTPEDLIQPEPL